MFETRVFCHSLLDKRINSLPPMHGLKPRIVFEGPLLSLGQSDLLQTRLGEQRAAAKGRELIGEMAHQDFQFLRGVPVSLSVV